MPLWRTLPANAVAMLGRDQAREDPHPAFGDDEVMIAAAERLAAALDDPQPPSLAAIDGRELIEMDDAVRDAMDRAVGGLGRSGRRAG